jgi:hypothetical protein
MRSDQARLDAQTIVAAWSIFFLVVASGSNKKSRIGAGTSLEGTCFADYGLVLFPQLKLIFCHILNL